MYITRPLKAIYAEAELSAKSSCKNDLQVRQQGARSVVHTVKLYNLDAILAVSYRVRSSRGTQFRRWTTERRGEAPPDPARR